MSEPSDEQQAILLENAKEQFRPKRAEQAGQSEATGASLDLRQPEARTGIANARRLIAWHGQNLRWCEPFRGWLIWQGKRWVLDRQFQANGMARQVAEEVWREVYRLLPDVPKVLAGNLITFANRTSSGGGIHEMLTLAKSGSGVAILPETLDTDPWLLNVNNGTLNLHSGMLFEHRRDDFITRLAPVDFVSGAEASGPLFDAFMTRIFDGKSDLIQYLQRLIGSALVGRVYDHALPIFWGKSGANGKSVLVDLLLHILGDYAATSPPGLLLVSQGYEKHPTELADLAGRRAIFCVETDQDRKLAEGRVKQLTGGDHVKGRFMRKDFFEFPASFTIFLVTNHLPVIKGVDDAIWRRPRVVPFTTVIPKEEQDNKLVEKLKAEAAAILAWCVQGCLAWQRDGLREPTEVVEATAEYREKMDVLAEFVEECCVVELGQKIKVGQLYNGYEQWCREHGEQKLSGRAFGLALTDRGFERFKSNGRWYAGISLK